MLFTDVVRALEALNSQGKSKSAKALSVTEAKRR
jgi:hypothetical protein